MEINIQVQALKPLNFIPSKLQSAEVSSIVVNYYVFLKNNNKYYIYTYYHTI